MKKTIFALCISAAFTALAATTLLSAQKAAVSEPRAVAARGALLENERSLVSLFENAAPSVAYITTENLVRGGFFGEQINVAQGAGSGFVCRK